MSVSYEILIKIAFEVRIDGVENNSLNTCTNVDSFYKWTMQNLYSDLAIYNQEAFYYDFLVVK